MPINWVTIVLFIVNLLYILVTVLGAFSIRRLVAQLDCNTKDIEEMKLNIAKDRSCIIGREELGIMLKEAIKTALTEQELKWLNEGRIKPKFLMKESKEN
jgi:hypothetical protein